MPKNPFKKQNISAVLSIIAGVLILIWPNILAFAIAIYLILIGLLNLLKK